MKKVLEKSMAEIIFITIVTLVMMSSCSVQKKVNKKCCIKTAQEVYEYEGLTNNINK